ncbi:MAG: hypothetical protein ACPLIG_00035 [Candidatus Bathyarchaeales archaeon]
MASKHIAELSELEKETIRILAEQGPKCGYDFHLAGKRKRGNRKAIMSSGKWIKVLAKIGPKGLNLIAPCNIRTPASTDERGRRKDLYWLTPEGVEVAAILGANRDSLIKNVEAVYNKSEVGKDLHLYLELSKHASSDLLAAASLLRKGGSDGKILNLMTPMFFQYSPKQAKRILQHMQLILKEHPEKAEFMNEKLRQSARKLRDIADFLEKT